MIDFLREMANCMDSFLTLVHWAGKSLGPILLIHEVWVGLQHANILLNPLCQRLDRNYGVALYENGMAWVIAFTLSAYWFREILSMILCFALSSAFTRQLVIISCCYHIFKIANVNLDAWRRWSPKLGIMRLLLDYWHWDTVVNCLISVKRIFLQGFDTAVHLFIVRDMVMGPARVKEGLVLVEVTSLIWIIHAVAVQLSRKSTATLMVELYTMVAVSLGLAVRKQPVVHASREPPSGLVAVLESTGKNKSKRESFVEYLLGPHIHAKHISERGCKVCRMLSKPSHSSQNMIRKSKLSSSSVSTPGSSSASPTSKARTPDVIFLAHPLQLASAFALWLPDKQDSEGRPWQPSAWMETPPVSWALGFVSAVLLPLSITLGRPTAVLADRVILQRNSRPSGEVTSYCQSVGSSPLVPSGDGLISYVTLQDKDHAVSRKEMICEVRLVKAFAWQYLAHPACFGIWRKYVTRLILKSARDARDQGCSVLGLGALNKAHFLNGGEDVLKALLKDVEEESIGVDCDVIGADDKDEEEEGLLSEVESGQRRVHAKASNDIGMWIVHGNTLTAAVVCEQIRNAIDVETTTIMSNAASCVSNMSKGASETAPNKPPSHEPQSRVDIIITGSTSKVGRAVAVQLCTQTSSFSPPAIMRNISELRVFLVGKDSQRMRSVITECTLAADINNITLKEDPSLKLRRTIICHCENVLQASERAATTALWVIGKWDSPGHLDAVIPFGAAVLSFAVPCPLLNVKNQVIRRDLRYASCGLMTAPEEFVAQRKFSVLLPRNQVYACHAAAIVHFLERWHYHEVGDVMVDKMEISLRAAIKHGFGVDTASVTKALQCRVSEPADHGAHSKDLMRERDPTYDVVVVGGGPSGLAAGAALMKQGVKNFVIVDQHKNIEGQWCSQYEHLSLTSRGQHSSLPFLQIPECLFDKNAATAEDEMVCSVSAHRQISASSYVRYLGLYARRLGLVDKIFLGYRAVRVQVTNKCNMPIPSDLTTLSETSCTGKTCEEMRTKRLSESLKNSERKGALQWEVHIQRVDDDCYREDTTNYPVESGERRRQEIPKCCVDHVLRCRCVVVSAGKASVPSADQYLLDTIASFKGRIVNAKDVNDIAGLVELGNVVVVGAGNSALDLCSLILEHREKRKNYYKSDVRPKSGQSTADPQLHLSMRTIPPCVPRQWGLLSVEGLSEAVLQYLPVRCADTVVLAFFWMLRDRKFTDKLPGRKRSPDWLPYSARRVPPIDKGAFIKAVREGAIQLHDTIVRVEGNHVFFKSAHESIRADAIVLCTGYTADLSWIHLDVSRADGCSHVPLKKGSLVASIDNVSYMTYGQSDNESKTILDIAKHRCIDPKQGQQDGLFFVGYDPGNALIPIGGIRNQAKAVAKEIQYVLHKAD